MDYNTEGVAEFVLDLFDKNYKGICIDVGAYHATWLNNSYLLEEKGWEVFCIEPNPHCQEMLVSRKNVYNYAMGTENKDNVDFYIYNLGHGPNGEAGGTGLIYYDHPQHLTTIKVKVRTLDWFIENVAKVDHVDFLAIDTEGSELDVLRGINLDRWGLKVIAVENLYYDAANLEPHNIEQDEYLTARGYNKIERIMFNDIYRRG